MIGPRLTSALGYLGVSLLGLVLGIVLFATVFVPDRCAYHEPENREPSPVVKIFFPQDPMGHPEPGFLYAGIWLTMGAGIFYLRRRQKCAAQKNPVCSMGG